MTIYDIKQATLETAPYFFTRDTLKFFGHTLKSFSVHRMNDGRFCVSAPIRQSGRPAGQTVRFYNPANNKLEIK